MSSILPFVGALSAVSLVGVGAVATVTGGASPVPMPRVAIAAVAAPPVRSVERASDGLFYVDARVNGVMVHFLIDTGSTHVVLSATDAARVKARDGQSRGHRVTIRTAGGTIVRDSATLRDVQMLGQSEHDVNCLIDESGQAGGLSLMGQSMLARFAMIRIEGDRLTLS